MDKPRVVTVRQKGDGWMVFFNVPVPLRKGSNVVPFDVSFYSGGFAFQNLPEDARYFWWAEKMTDDGPVHYTGDALGAYVWGVRLLEKTYG